MEQPVGAGQPHFRHFRGLTPLPRSTTDPILVACNFTPVPRLQYRLGAPHGGTWREILNSDATEYGGGGTGNLGKVGATPVGQHGRNHSILVTLPPLAAELFKPYPTISQKS